MNVNSNKKQPGGLFICSFLEIWERLGFFIVQSSLVLFLVQQLKFSDIKAYSLYSAFSGLLYAGPIVGGIIGDKFLNLNKSIFLGICFFIVGYAVLAISSSIAFYLAFGLLIAGNSFLKSNVSALVGSLYKENDLRRDAGFTLFYLGINIGQIIGPVAAALAIKYYSFSVAFLIASASLVICFLSFFLSQKYLKEQCIDNDVFSLKTNDKTKNLIYAFSIAAIIIISLLIQFPRAVNISIIILSIGAILYLLYYGLNLKNSFEKLRLFTLIILFLFASFYWGIFMQIFTSLTLFTSRNVNMAFMGWKVPTQFLVAFESVGILIFAPLLAKLWSYLGEKQKNPSFPVKFSYGFLFCGFAFSILVFALSTSSTGKISIVWIIASMFLLALSELSLSAIGMSAVAMLSPRNMASTMMGFWFVTIAAGLMIANKLANISIVTEPMNTIATAHIYNNAFCDYSIMSYLMFILLLAMSPIIKKMSNQSK